MPEGAVVARYILDADPGASVVMLESGPLITNEQFSDRFLKGAAELYMNGAATLSANQKYTFTQGRCVGGSTTVNNAVSLKPRDFWWNKLIVERWSNLGAELNWDELAQAFDQVAPAINVQNLDSRVISPMAKKIKAGFRREYPSVPLNVVKVNLEDCIGCGRCNLGCQYDAKKSMLVTMIPEFLDRGGVLVPDAKVTRIIFEEHSGRRTVTGLEVKTKEGDLVHVKADRYVLAAGAFASSKLLWRSGYIGSEPGVRTVGKRFSGNFGTPVSGIFATAQNGADGQQVGYMIEIPEEKMVIETAFAPPAAFGMIARQWGSDFMKLAERFNDIAIAVPVFCSSSFGEIKRGLNPSGFVIDYQMVFEDWFKLSKGLKMIAKAMFSEGAEEVMVPRFDGSTLKQGPDLEKRLNRYFALGPIDYLHIQTAHMQGGNVIHEDPNQGVVNSDMKVHGFENLWIADASVIPSPITLNIQFTVMALARYAASRIVAG